ncbi:hypothetical protein B4U80_12975 [Leptotrombidium deliense]|uniref:Serpin domain-containing protein n=1 Tax=Leptotrombidium deliense TaxID=299467 RepID=A0A443SFZ2_9ACAR|nr:hypothetical protein B4U80_12975 [Leptotrombidium deliense]
MGASNETNPVHAALNGLSASLVIAKSLNQTKKVEVFENCGLSKSFTNTTSALTTLTRTKLDLCYSAINILVIADNFNVKDEYWLFLQRYKYAQVKKSNLKSNLSDETAQIRDQLKNATNNTIDKEIESFVKLSDSYQFVYLSASSFSEKFEIEFDINKTANGTFYNDDTNVTFTAIMKNIAQYKHYSDEKLSAVQLQLESGNHLLIMRPNKTIGYKKLLDNLTSEWVLNVINKLEMKVVKLKLPRFKSLTESRIKKAIPGVHKNETLRNVTDSGNIKFSDAFVVNYIEVNEEGVKPAEYNQNEPKIKFYIHRPFLYFIFSKENIVLFAGIVNRLNI